MLWQQLEDMQTECDLFVVGGDVFDKLPNIIFRNCLVRQFNFTIYVV